MPQKRVVHSGLEEAVRSRYSGGARQREESLCCPVPQEASLLATIPGEVVERDYGCGDPTRHLRAGETVLDLGSGTGKACFMASQVVGPEGRVIGVDMTDDMLELARRSAPIVAQRIGFANVEFRKGRIQDLRLDIELLDAALAAKPARSAADLLEVELAMEELRATRPLVAEASVDVVVSNCVLNLVLSAEKQRLFAEIHRVLRTGGRAVISDIVSDEDVPDHLARDPELWSGCVSGAMREDRFIEAFAAAGLYGVTVIERQDQPWRTVEGIEFRSITVAAFKGKEGPCLDGLHAVIYRGPFRQVEDDDGHVLRRGERSAVCEKTFRVYAREPYREHVALVPPQVAVPLEEMKPFACIGGDRLRHPGETKNGDGPGASDSACEPGANGGCC